MAKTNRTSPHKQQFEDEYEDFGYDVKNARRYQSNKKRTPKFKDYNDYEDSWTSVTVNEHSDWFRVMYMSRQEFSNVWWTLVWNSRHARWDLWHRRFQSWCKGSLSDCLRAWCQTPRNPQRLINTMLFTVKDIEFDFDADDVTPEEMIDITDDTLGTWEANDEDDLIDEISTQTGWCIRSIDYVVQLR